ERAERGCPRVQHIQPPAHRCEAGSTCRRQPERPARVMTRDRYDPAVQPDALAEHPLGCPVVERKRWREDARVDERPKSQDAERRPEPVTQWAAEVDCDGK